MTPFERLLLKRLMELKEGNTSQLSTTKASDYADYSQRFGYLQAINDVLGIIEEIQLEVRKD